MPIFKKGKQDLLFIHVPKTGGTSLEKLFDLSGWRTAYLDLNLKGQSFNHLRICSPQHMHAEMLQQQLLIDKFTGIFMIVRHPYDRFRSEYAYMNKGNCDPSAHAVEVWTRKAMKAYAKNPFVFDNHLRPQHEFYLRKTDVYKLEEGFNNIVERLAVKYKIQFVDEELQEMSREKESGFSSRGVELNDTVKGILNIFYRYDFQKFGYEPEPVDGQADTVGQLLDKNWLHRMKRILLR